MQVQEGLGALLKKNHGLLENPQWHPIGYSSRALRDYDKRYAQIQKETLSEVFGVECFTNIYTVINLPSVMTVNR